jgi:HK97 family phage portal protein
MLAMEDKDLDLDLDEEKDLARTEAKTIREYERAMSAGNLEEKSYNIFDTWGTEGGSGLWSPDVKAAMDVYTLKSLLFSEDWVFICCDRYASKIAGVPLVVMQKSIQNGKKVTTVVEDHPVTKMLENPNDYQTYFQFMYSYVADLMISGNAIAWTAFVSRQLIQIPVEGIYIDVDVSNHVVRSYQVLGNSPQDYPNLNSKLRIPPNQIAHARRPNPSSMLWGLSPFIPGRKSVLFDRYSSEYLNNFYIKGAQPGLALEIGEEANEQLALRLLRSFEAAHSGRKNQRRNLILPKGVTVKDVSHSLADQHLSEYLDRNRETIINLLQIPKHEFSIANAGSLGSEEYKTALKNFWNGPLRDTMGLVAQTLTKTLRPMLGPDQYLEFDLTEVGALQDDKLKKAELAIKMRETHTLNEVRAELYDAPPLKGGDEIPAMPHQSTPFGNPNASFSMDKPLQVTEPTPMAPVVPTMEDKEVPATDETKAVYQRNTDRLNTWFKAADGWWDKRQAKLDEAHKEGEKAVAKVIGELFADQAYALVKTAKEYMSEKGVGGYRAKAEGDKPDSQPKTEITSKSELRRRLRSTNMKFEDRYVSDMTKALEAQVELGYDSQLVLPFNLPNRSELEALRARNAKDRRETLELRSIQSFDRMTQTTTEKVMSTIEQGVSDGKTIPEISKDVSETLSGAVSDSRVNTIVRTETLTAVSLGQAAAMQDAAKVVPNLKKAWVNAGDERVRGNPGGLSPNSEADHWQMQGQVQDYDKPFVDPRSGTKLMFPRDPSGGPSDVINCRCSFIMVPEDDANSLGLESAHSEGDV